MLIVKNIDYISAVDTNINSQTVTSLQLHNVDDDNVFGGI